MARRSNKTAHVLNLIAGHEATKEEAEEAVSTDGGESTERGQANPSAQSEQTAPAGQDTSAPAVAAAPASPAQNISVIDTTEEDPVADLIQQKLSDVLAGETQAESPVTTTASQPEPKVLTTPETPLAAEPAPILEAAPTAETSSVAESDPLSATTPETSLPVSASSDVMDTPTATPSSETTADITVTSPISESVPTPESAPISPSVTPPTAESISEPETVAAPAFAAVNVMEAIVRDKIIYYMRQFDVCTCDRCVADTIALTLNGLMPKYIVTDPAAVDPLISYYTNRLISDVTVEATKACVIVKEQPRH